MKHLALIIPAAAALLMTAAEPAGFVHWKAGELKGLGAKLATRMDAKKVAVEQLGNFGNHLMMVAHREGNGEAEVHDGKADIFIVQEGEATLVHGGEVVDPKTTAPGETRGPSIRGGEKIRLAPGDMVHIPVRVPHQLLLAPGAKFTYAVVKIDAK
jgi:mannose-6-phosphate isomerase-like protein (cupin superfamily)